VVVPRALMKTTAHIDPPEIPGLSVAETLELPRWSAPKKWADPQIIYKMTVITIKIFKEISIV
tara:strand:+ start:1617 stop:1805 length:189 start_codon:yes stop_codon:yes gene_type:complete